MKKINYILAFLAVGALAFACTSKEEAYTPGEPEVEGCYRVSFPKQTVISSYELDPTDASASTVTIKAKRQVTTGKITVPLTIEQVPFDSAFVFKNTDLVFEDGESEASFEVSFPDAAIGVEYSCHVMVTDPQYVSMYSKDTTYISFSFLKVSWENVATGSLDSWWAEGVIDDVVFQHCLTFPERYRFIDPWGTGVNPLFTTDGKVEKDNDGDEYVVMRVAPQELNDTFGSYGMISFRDVAYWQGDDSYASANKYYPADKYCQLWLQWYVSAGSLGYGYEKFQGK